MDDGCEALIGFVCPHRDAFEFLELAEEILDQVPPLVEFGVQRQGAAPAVGAERSRFLRRAREVGNDGIAVEGLVGDQSAEGDSVDQRSDADLIETVAGQQDEADQIAERVGQRQVFSLSCRPWSGRSPGLASPFCALTVAMDFDDGGIDHGVFHLRLV